MMRNDNLMAGKRQNSFLTQEKVEGKPGKLYRKHTKKTYKV